MQHDYTDEEIKTAWRDSLSLRAFLAALPERPQAQPVVVNEPPQDERQPDLSGESEKQAEAQPWTPAVGDTVRLKSGGPVMMVTGISITDAFVCEWFIETNVLCKRGFPAACLTPVQS